MLRILGECINDIAHGNIFKPFDRIANVLVNCVFHPIRTLKVWGPLLLILFVVGKCSGSFEKEKTVQRTQTQAVQQAQSYAYVNSEALNMRSGPSVQTDIIIVLHKNDKVQLIERVSSSSNWIKIRVGNYEGYVSADYLRQ
jgi:hypothetical protein